MKLDWPLSLTLRQNNALLASLSQKTSALKHITLDIYDNARSQDTLDNTNEVFSNMSTSIKGSAGRLTRMAKQGDKVAVLKLAGIIIVALLLIYYVGGWIWGLLFGS
jgi:blocked-early-in-transport protein 1